MDNTLRQQVLNLPTQEKSELLELLWDALASSDQNLSIPDSHRSILRSRLARYDAVLEDVKTGESVRDRFLR